MAAVCFTSKLTVPLCSSTAHCQRSHFADKNVALIKFRSWNTNCLFHCKSCSIDRVTFRSGANTGVFASLATEAVVGNSGTLDSRLGVFWTWFLEKSQLNAAKVPVRPRIVPEGLGLVAERNLGSGDDIFNVPDSICITKETVKASPIGKYVTELKPWIGLALFLISERNNTESSWKAYLDILPTELDLPLFWTEEELSEIQGTQLLGSVESYREYLETEFKRLQEEVLSSYSSVFDAEIFTRDAFIWAFGILRSRTFPPLTGEDIALVPLADFINHGLGGSVPAKAIWEKREGSLFDRQKMVAMRAGRSYSAGDQVFLEYGQDKSNGQLALDFGFAEKETAMGASKNIGRRSRDSFTLTLEIAESDRLFDDKADIAELNGMSTTAYFDLLRGEGPPEDMLTYLRLTALGGPDSFLLEALFRNAVWGHLGLPVSRENEEAVCQAMIDGCRSALSGFKTSIEQDIRLLKDTGLSVRQETAVIVRLGEKQILVELLDWFEARMQGLDNLEYYAERRLRDLGLLDDRGNMTPWVFNE